jgi:hypothetical protein
VTRWRLAAFAVTVGVLCAGCATGTQPEAGPNVVNANASKVALVLKPAAGKPVIELKGLVNGGKPAAIDMASLDALPKRSLTIVEPFVKKSMTFTGVSFGDLLTAAKATGKSVNIHALDDFQANLSVAVLRDSGVLLATRADGKLIELKNGGPVRMVFPPSAPTGKDTNNWVWSIDQITVK